MARHGVVAGDVERTGDVESHQLEQGRGEIADLHRAANLVREERRRLVEGGQLVLRRRRAAVDQRGAHEQCAGVRSEDAILGCRLRAAVLRHGRERVVLAVGATEPTVEDHITREVELNAAQSRFISNVSHELRTPLFNIKSFIETLHEYGDELSDDQKKEFLGTANSETDRLTRLVNDVLDLSRLESGRQFHFTAIDLSETIEQTVRTYKLNASSKGVELLHEISPDLDRIWGNYDLILQVLYNLVGNALKFTETGGKVTIRIYPWQDQTTTQPHRVVNYVRVEVEDTGYGIPAEDCDRIFDRFYRVEDKVHTLEGTGLGLSIVRNIIEKHHSEIHIKSEVGVGSTFWFDLSVYQDRCELPVVTAIAAPIEAMSV